MEKIIAKPTRFRAIPIPEAVSILLERKLCFCSSLREKAREFTKKTVERYSKATRYQERNQFVLIPEREAIIFKAKEALENSQENMYIVTPCKEFVPLLVALAESFNKALTRGVNIRWVTEKPENTNLWPQIVRNFIKKPQFKLRTISNTPEAKVGIYDNKEMMMGLFVEYNTAESPALVSNNPSLLSIAEGYFEAKWKTGIEYKAEEQ